MSLGNLDLHIEPLVFTAAYFKVEGSSLSSCLTHLLFTVVEPCFFLYNKQDQSFRTLI